MLNRKQKHVLLKFFSMFSVVRGYNILVIVLAQYLASIFIFGKHLSLGQVVFDPALLMLVVASAVSIAGGYIINNFYDSEKDLINRPNKSMLDKLVSQNTKLSFYFVLNFSAAIMASYVSFTAVLFFAVYIFLLWFYSHKLKRYAVLGNLISAILTITPFFALLIYYKHFNATILWHAFYLFLLILIKEIVKDLENIKGDITLDYKTIPIQYGVKKTKLLIAFLIGLTIIPVSFLVNCHIVGQMKIYFLGSIAVLLFCLFLLWKATTKKQYVWLHNIIKIVMILGVLSILLIDVDLVINRIF